MVTNVNGMFYCDCTIPNISSIEVAKTKNNVESMELNELNYYMWSAT